MGMTETLVNSIVKVIAGIIGFGLFIAGAQHAALGSTVGGVVALVGIILLVFAAQL